MTQFLAGFFVLLTGFAAHASEGGLTREQVEDTVHRNLSSVRGCYEAELEKKPTVAGKVRVKFEVSKTGRVSAAAIEESDLKDEKIEACIIDQVKKWMFPEPSGGVSVTASYPFEFKNVKPNRGRRGK